MYALRARGMNKALGHKVALNYSATSKSFVNATAKVLGKDKSTVRRDAERGRKINGRALDMLRDTGVYLGCK